MLKLSWTSIIGCLILLATLFLIAHTFNDAYNVSILTAGRGPVFYPRFVLAAMLLFSLLVIQSGVGKRPDAISTKSFLTVLSVIAVSGMYIASIITMGFLMPTIAFSIVLPILLGYRNWKITVVVGAIYPVVVWYVFQKIFLIVLPTSPWFDAF